MATYNVKFTWQLSTAASDTTASVNLHVVDASNNIIGDVTINPASQQSFWVLALPPGNGHKATLTAHNSLGVPNANPPVITFNVVAVAPPGDPTINAPVQVP